MDFEIAYSREQEQFRQEVRTWLEDNIPEDMKEPIDSRDFTDEHYRFWREMHKKLAQKGWLYPTYPKEYGGGGLTGDHETIIEEEFLRTRVPRTEFIASIPPICSTLIVWGTEEQRQKFLVPLLKGEKSAWKKFTKPQSGADFAIVQTQAVRDGDDWLITGQNVFHHRARLTRLALRPRQDTP